MTLTLCPSPRPFRPQGRPRLATLGLNPVIVVLVSALAGCSLPQPAAVDAPAAEIDLFVKNRSETVVEIEMVGGTTASLTLVPPCEAVHAGGIEIFEGMTLHAGDTLLWRFDDLPPPEIGAMHVIVDGAGRPTVNLVQRIPQEVPLVGRCE